MTVMSWLSRLRDQSHQNRKQQPPSHAKHHRPFQAVSIYSTKLVPCNAAQQVQGRIYLAKDAPSLPLTGCPKPQHCSCRYRYHEDRRQDLRRDADCGLPNRSAVGEERRCRKDRRQRCHSQLSNGAHHSDEVIL